MMHIRARIVTAPGGGRDVFVLQFVGILCKADDIEPIARILHLDQTMERQGHFFGCLKAAVEAHGAALVQHQDGRTLVEVLRTEHLKILWHHPYRGALAMATHRIHHAVLQVQVKRIAILIELGIVCGLNTHAMPIRTMPTRPPDLQTVEDIMQRFLADLPYPLWGELEAVAFPFQIAGCLQTTLEIPQLLEFLTPFWPQDLFERFRVNVL